MPAAHMRDDGEQRIAFIRQQRRSRGQVDVALRTNRVLSQVDVAARQRIVAVVLQTSSSTVTLLKLMLAPKIVLARAVLRSAGRPRSD